MNGETDQRRRNQRIKLLVMLVIFAPIAAYGLFHLGYAVYKMTQGEAVGYQQRDTPPGIAE